MSWWQNWRHALAHPADNVVAAMVVLIGVAITAITTLLVSSANRKHERRQASDDRLFEARAEVYMDASKWLHQWYKPDQVLREEPDDYIRNTFDLTTRLNMYGGSNTPRLFVAAADSAIKYRKMAGGEYRTRLAELEKARREANDLIAEFDEVSIANLQGVRISHIWVERMLNRKKD